MHVTINIINSITLFFALIFLFLSISCDAPRNNPLDPQNPENNYYIIEGIVKTVSIPNQPLQDVIVSFRDLTNLTETNASGNFKIEMLSGQNGWLQVGKEDFLTDSLYIEWGNTRKINTEHFLNAIPHLDSLQVYSIILNRYPSLQTEQVVVQAKISDSDNDIDSVQVVIAKLSFIETLEYDVKDKWYKQIFSIYDLEIGNVEELVGHDFNIRVKDIFANKFFIGIGIIERVIREEIFFQTPSGNEITSPSPTLIWQRFTPGFNFTYSLQIYTAEIGSQLVWEKEALDADLVNYIVDIVLPANEYYWVVWAVDEFGNRTRSKPASFKVE